MQFYPLQYYVERELARRKQSTKDLAILLRKTRKLKYLSTTTIFTSIAYFNQTSTRTIISFTAAAAAFLRLYSSFWLYRFLCVCATFTPTATRLRKTKGINWLNIYIYSNERFEDLLILTTDCTVDHSDLSIHRCRFRTYEWGYSRN